MIKKLIPIFVILTLLVCVSAVSATNTNDTTTSDHLSKLTQDNTATTNTYSAKDVEKDTTTQDKYIQSNTKTENTQKTQETTNTQKVQTSTQKVPTTKTIKTANTPSKTIYISTNGKDSNSGTKNAPKATIKNAMKNIANGGTIYLNKGTYYENSIYINKKVTIIGAGTKNTILNGKNKHVFTIKENVIVTFKTFRITKAKDKQGGAIYNKGTLNLNSMKISSSKAINDGGAIYNKGKINARKSSFASNTAKQGGAIYNDGSITMTQCTYDHNSATNLGSVIYSVGKITLTQNNITKNTNTAIYIGKNKNNNNIKSSQFISNRGINGAAIYNDGLLNVNKNTFKSNKATKYGGAIYNKGTYNSISSKYSNSYAIVGGAIYNKNILYIHTNTYTSNNAKKEGGAIYNKLQTTIKASVFQSNKVTNQGGAIASNVAKSQKNLIIESTSFKNNVANIGGAISARGYTKLNIKKSIFTSNKNNAIFIKTTKTKHTLSNNTFSKNSATRGGAIYNDGSILTITKTILSSNYAKKVGGAIYNYKGKISITNSVLLNNKNKDIYNSKGKIVSANYNWWGSNAKPSSSRVYNTTIKNWIFFKISSPASKYIKETTTITTTFNYIYNGKKLSPHSSNKYLPALTVKITIKGAGITKTYTKHVNGLTKINVKFPKSGSVTVTAYTYSITSKATIKIKSKTTLTTGIFVQMSATVNKNTVNKWVKAGVTDVYVQARASTSNMAKLKKVISLCKNKNIKVHAWVICFQTDNGFDISTKQQNLIKKFVTKVTKISGVEGVCLDYVRYSGTKPSIVKPSKITNFVKAVKNILKKQNKNLVLSVCVFAEKSKTKQYYGQDYAAMSPYVDVMMPMAYKYDYNSGRNWLKDVTKYVVNKAKYSKVVTILQTYKEKSWGYKTLSATELKNDAKAVMSAGSKGYTLFRYGLISSYPTSAKLLA